MHPPVTQRRNIDDIERLGVIPQPSSTRTCCTQRLKTSDDSGEEDTTTNREHKDQDIVSLPPVEVGPSEHRLQYTYSLWYSRRAPGKQATTQNYDQNLKLMGRFASVEQFWSYYSHLVRPAELASHSDIHIFKDGIKPMWEDIANKNGGKWIVRLRKGLASRCWENLLLAMLGEQFMVGDEICGAVISVRYQEDIISVWNRTASDSITTAKIRDTLKRVLNLPPNTIMEYKTHTDSLNCLFQPRDHSSFRNTRADGFSSRAEGFLR
ncbi:eukaryotic translation initiation factor 4E type 2-like isoform X3 [Oratosquilla oratoria]|uniref:eukaryotic translation initiation factor 4E type 2-like isoform X3 n=1 Tax=Oratosquilla oratoria TaxID=337810 RepID=UPI003F761B23